MSSDYLRMIESQSVIPSIWQPKEGMVCACVCSSRCSVRSSTQTFTVITKIFPVVILPICPGDDSAAVAEGGPWDSLADAAHCSSHNKASNSHRQEPWKIRSPSPHTVKLWCKARHHFVLSKKEPNGQHRQFSPWGVSQHDAHGAYSDERSSLSMAAHRIIASLPSRNPP